MLGAYVGIHVLSVASFIALDPFHGDVTRYRLAKDFHILSDPECPARLLDPHQRLFLRCTLNNPTHFNKSTFK